MGWYFPINDGGEFHGIGDSGIDLFKGEPVKSLAREICQNSIDASVNENAPVRVEFNLFSINTAKLPDVECLKEYFELAQKFCQKQNFKKAQKYFERSIPVLENSNIFVLRISDFNTTGLPGAMTADDDLTSPWFRLVRSVGSSDKADGSIGSYGSGKKAAFACSNLQTVFYSTFVENEGRAYQGVTKLIGFKDKKQQMHSDIGYFCEKKSMPVLEEFNLDENFNRIVPGTDVFIIGFKFVQQDWKKELISAVLDGFFYAIKEKHLIVNVNDVVIDSESIERFIEEYKEHIDEKTYDYYKLMMSEKTTRRYYSCMSDKDIEVQMLVEPKLHKRVAIIRYPGMKIFDKGQISTTIPFAGICVIRGKKLAKLLGGLENIQHNKWELSRYDEDPEKRKEAQRQRDAVYKYIRELFTELRGQDTEGEIDPEIGDCLPDPISENEEKKEVLSDEVMEIGKVKEITVKPPSEIKVEDENGEEVSRGDKQLGNGGGKRDNSGTDTGSKPGSNPGPGPGLNSGSNPPFKQKEGDVIPAKPIRATIIYRDENYVEGKYRIWVTPQKDLVDGRIDIYMGAETDSYRAEILKATMNESELEIDGCSINGLSISKGNEVEIDIQINYSDICSLEVKIYGH